MSIFAKKVDDTEITDFIEDHKGNHSIQTMCNVLDMPRSTYYQSRDKTISKREQENNELTEKIIEIHNDSQKRYGAPKIHQILIKKGYQVGMKRVQRFMKKRLKVYYCEKVSTNIKQRKSC